MRTKYRVYATLIKNIAQKYGDERASKCGYDLMLGLEYGNIDDREVAWERYLAEEKDSSHTDEERNGVWVPSIPL